MAGKYSSAQIGPPKETLAGDLCVWDLRKLKSVVIPNSLEEIGNYWFYGTDIESVEISASIREIQTDAFCRSKLRTITFAKESRLERLGPSCFEKSTLETI